MRDITMRITNRGTMDFITIWPIPIGEQSASTRKLQIEIQISALFRQGIVAFLNKIQRNLNFYLKNYKYAKRNFILLNLILTLLKIIFILKFPLPTKLQI